mmetsp:Transcript_19118/g.36826  ORF Transcript_19118/g.36826 Transcript_19118/m.36826 type:complete len:509 (-) Transcript_19118:130-1656(-)
MLWAFSAAIVAAYLVALAACRTPGSVYCFALVTPYTTEPHLLAAQYLLNVGVFQCDGWDIISNVSAEVLLRGHWEAISGVKDNFGVVDTELFVKQVQGPPGFDPSSPQTIQGSGQFLHSGAKHLANTPVFQKVWDKVFQLGRWREYEWTIKLDVDAVPLPLRLHSYLKTRPKRALGWDPKIPGEELPYRAEYLYNARHDMYRNFLHGPAEAVSRAAMLIYEQGNGRCKKKIPSMEFGEDFYLNKCLELLGIPSVKAAEVPLLYDTYEWGEVAQKTCYAQKVDGKFQYFAVYHAHKTIEDWLDCYAQAKSGPTISREMKRLAIAEAKRSNGPPTTTATTTTSRTTTTVTKDNMVRDVAYAPAATTHAAPSATVHTHTTEEVMVLARSEEGTVNKEVKHGWLMRTAGQLSQIWPLVSLLAAGLVVAPFYGLIRRRNLQSRDSDGELTEDDVTRGRVMSSESRMPLVDASGLGSEQLCQLQRCAKDGSDRASDQRCLMLGCVKEDLFRTCW